jgi:flagellin
VCVVDGHEAGPFLPVADRYVFVSGKNEYFQMASLNTNASAMTALQTLSATNKNLATTQSRISTGFRVGEAADNAAYWSIATTMRSDNKALSTVQDALGLGAGKIDVAYTGMNAAIDVVDEIKAKLVAALGVSDDDRTKIQAEIGTPTAAQGHRRFRHLLGRQLAVGRHQRR